MINDSAGQSDTEEDKCPSFCRRVRGIKGLKAGALNTRATEESHDPIILPHLQARINILEVTDEERPELPAARFLQIRYWQTCY